MNSTTTLGYITNPNLSTYPNLNGKKWTHMYAKCYHIFVTQDPSLV